MTFNEIVNSLNENTYKSENGQYFFNKTKQDKTDKRQQSERNKQLMSDYSKFGKEYEDAKKDLINALKNSTTYNLKADDQLESMLKSLEQTISAYKKARLQVKKNQIQVASNNAGRQQTSSEFDRKNAGLSTYTKNKEWGDQQDFRTSNFKDLDRAKADTQKRIVQRKIEAEKKKDTKKSIFKRFFGH